MSWRDALASTWIGRIITGIIKLALIPVVIAILNSINLDLSNIDLGGTTIDLSVIVTVVKVFAPLFLLISGLRDLGVRF